MCCDILKIGLGALFRKVLKKWPLFKRFRKTTQTIDRTLHICLSFFRTSLLREKIIVPTFFFEIYETFANCISFFFLKIITFLSNFLYIFEIVRNVGNYRWPFWIYVTSSFRFVDFWNVNISKNMKSETYGPGNYWFWLKQISESLDTNFMSIKSMKWKLGKFNQLF